ncbi:MAG: hypothetical protein CBD88_08330 [Flavobacteriales bacterium TMED228]|nr:MAG: hypothetical protein CBD88_08330 [Flavobacteriales bacterium TMED228]|tara:strand:- start:7134 stop:7361 length:228 start_codon:yes stop_codon:yes gene_type:complete
MSDFYSYDEDVTDDNDTRDPIDLMIRDLVDYKLNACSVQEMLSMASSWMTQDLENRTITEVQQLHDGLFAAQELH